EVLEQFDSLFHDLSLNEPWQSLANLFKDMIIKEKSPEAAYLNHEFPMLREAQDHFIRTLVAQKSAFHNMDTLKVFNKLVLNKQLEDLKMTRNHLKTLIKKSGQDIATDIDEYLKKVHALT